MTNQYRVFLETVVGTTIYVDAEDPDEAIELAIEQAPGSVCAQCSGWGQRGGGIDLSGEWDISGSPEESVEIVEPS